MSEITQDALLRPPFPPFNRESAIAKVQMAEDAWNSRDPQRVSLAYTEDTEWRNRSKFLKGRAEVQAFLSDKWKREQDYRLRKWLWSFTDNRISVKFEYNTTMPLDNGFGLTATSNGNSPPTVSCNAGKPV